MLKKSRFLILCFLLSVQWVQGRSFVKTHEDFVNLPETEQDALIVKTMELATELEERYEKDLEVYGYNQQRFLKYHEALTKLSSLFIDSAYADSSKMDWTALGNDFMKLLQKQGSNCLFAGWVSTASKDKSGKTTCAHPGKGKSYPAPEANSSCKKGDPKKIQCSPVIFGYKKESDKSLFCVDATSGAHNSSYNCMKEALADSPAQKGDPKATRLKNLRDRLAKNPEIFKGVQEFAYKTCVCEETDKSANFNSDYHKYMRPHRTCYGLMEMIAETTICEDPKLPMDVSIFKGLRNFTKNKIASNSDADKLYTDFLNLEVKKAAPQEFARLCGGESTPKLAVEGPPPIDESKIQKVHVTGKNEITCSVTCRPDAKKDSPFICSYVLKDQDGESVSPSKTPLEQPKSKEDKSIEINVSIKGKERKLTCEHKFEEEKEKPKDTGPKPTLKIALKDETAKDVKITAEVTDKGDWTLVWKTTVTKKSKKTKTTTTMKGLASGKDVESEDEAEKPEKKEEKAQETTTEDDVDSLEITRAREEETYKVCAELRKESETVPGDCVEVKALEKKEEKKTAPSTPLPPTNNTPQQNMVPRQQLNSGAQGMF